MKGLLQQSFRLRNHQRRYLSLVVGRSFNRVLQQEFGGLTLRAAQRFSTDINIEKPLSTEKRNIPVDTPPIDEVANVPLNPPKKLSRFQQNVLSNNDWQLLKTYFQKGSPYLFTLEDAYHRIMRTETLTLEDMKAFMLLWRKTIHICLINFVKGERDLFISERIHGFLYIQSQLRKKVQDASDPSILPEYRRFMSAASTNSSFQHLLLAYFSPPLRRILSFQYNQYGKFASDHIHHPETEEDRGFVNYQRYVQWFLSKQLSILTERLEQTKADMASIQQLEEKIQQLILQQQQEQHQQEEDVRLSEELVRLKTKKHMRLTEVESTMNQVFYKKNYFFSKVFS
jgi:hypothetical protein